MRLPAIKLIGIRQNKKFVRIKDKRLPFKDNEFDFVISSHVIEHVEDFKFFIIFNYINRRSLYIF